MRRLLIYWVSMCSLPSVKLIQEIPATRETPALYEIALTLDGEPKVLIVQKNPVELRKEKLLQKRESDVTQ